METPGWSPQVFGHSRRGTPLQVYLPANGGPVEGLLVGALHGEEPETLLLLRRVLERVAPDALRWAVVPVLNPDGVLDGTRQNAAGVDVNRNFPTATWRPDPSFTYPPGCDDRRRPNRTNRSLPGPEPASEPEVRALLDLVERLRPPLVVDLHSPLDVLFAGPEVPDDLLAGLRERTGLEVRNDLDVATPGALRDWCAEQGIASITYEVGHAALPDHCGRHVPALCDLVAGRLRATAPSTTP